MRPMKIKALAPWFGSKRVAIELGEHRSYWEPFCGSMAVLLAKPIASSETVNDLHGDLINLSLVIRHRRWGPWLYRQLRRTLIGEEMHKVSRARMLFPGRWTPLYAEPERIEEADAKRAYWYFIWSWLGRNGMSGTKHSNITFCRRFTVNGGYQGTRFAAAVDSIPAWRRRMREVTILAADGFDLLAKIDDQPGTSLYVDPPYLVKSERYIHDFADADHERLAGLLARFRQARVVVSYYDDPRLDELYPGWTKVACALSKSLSVQGARGSTNMPAPEVLLVNGPSYAQRGLFD